MEYERVEGRSAVAAMLRRLAAGVESGTVECAGLALRTPATVSAAMIMQEVPGAPIESITVRLSQAGELEGASALEREMAHPGD